MLAALSTLLFFTSRLLQRCESERARGGGALFDFRRRTKIDYRNNGKIHGIHMYVARCVRRHMAALRGPETIIMIAIPFSQEQKKTMSL